MANNIDASIALNAGNNVPQFDPMGAAQKGMNLQRTVLENANLPTKLANENAASQVATARAQQELEQQKRENATRVRAAQIAKDYTKKDADGNRIIDHSGIANQLSEEGQDPGIIFGYQQKAIENQRGKFDNATVVKNLTDNITTTHDNMMRVAKSPQQALGIMRSTHDLLLPVLGEAGTKQFLSNRYGGDNLQGVDPNDPSVQAQVAKHFVDTSEGYAKARSISPQQEIANRQTEESLRQGREGQAMGGASGVSGPEARNPTSAVSRQAQEDYLAANPTADRAKVIGLSAAEIQHLAGPSAVIASSIPSAGERAGAKKGAALTSGDVDIIDAALAAIPKLQQTFGTQLGSMGQDTYNRLVTQNKELGNLDAAVQAYNQRNGTNVDVRKDGFAAVQARLKGESGRLGKLASAQADIANNPTLVTPPKAATEAPAPALRKTGDIIKRNGKAYVYTGKTGPVGSAATKDPKNYKVQ
jgi:hypothetical protein